MVFCQLPNSTPEGGSGGGEERGMSAREGFYLVVGIFLGWVSMLLVIALS